MILRNLVANVFGDLWLTMLQFAIVPVCLAVLGPEAYGMIAFHTTLMALAGIANLGITPALNREIARLSGIPDGPSEIKSFTYSVAVVFLAITLALAVVAFTWLTRPAAQWINPQSLSSETTERLIGLMFAQIVIQLLIGFFVAVLQGLQLHVKMNLIVSIGMTFRVGGALLGLLYWQSNLEFYFHWLIVSSIPLLLALALFVHRALPKGVLRVSSKYIQGIWKYASGVTLTVIFSLLLTQIDKVALSRLLTLSEFGIYALSSSFAAATTRSSGPLSRTFLPSLTQLVAQEKVSEAAERYHLGCQIASLAIIPLAAVFAIFPYEVLSVLMIAPKEAAAAAPLLSPLSIAFAALGLMALPYCLTLAFGWVRFGLYQNVFACLFFTPVMIFATLRYGAIGSALSWAGLTVSCMLISPYFIHRKFLPKSYARWYLADIFPSVLASAAVGGLLFWAKPGLQSWMAMFVWLAFALVALLGSSWLVLFQLRHKTIHFGRAILAKRRVK